MKYYLTDFWQGSEIEVTRSEYIQAERNAGFFPKGDQNDIASYSFYTSGIGRGRTECEESDLE